MSKLIQEKKVWLEAVAVIFASTVKKIVEDNRKPTIITIHFLVISSPWFGSKNKIWILIYLVSYQPAYLTITFSYIQLKKSSVSYKVLLFMKTVKS